MTEATDSDPAGIWTRLRRRKVVQWGLVYVAAAWGFLQGLSDGFGISDVQILALRGKTVEALAALQAAEQQGWRGRYYRDFEPNLASIRNEPEFKAVFADMARDMARQRAALAALPKDAPIELGPGLEDARAGL